MLLQLFLLLSLSAMSLSLDSLIVNLNVMTTTFFHLMLLFFFSYLAFSLLLILLCFFPLVFIFGHEPTVFIHVYSTHATHMHGTHHCRDIQFVTITKITEVKEEFSYTSTPTSNLFSIHHPKLCWLAPDKITSELSSWHDAWWSSCVHKWLGKIIIGYKTQPKSGVRLNLIHSNFQQLTTKKSQQIPSKWGPCKNVSLIPQLCYLICDIFKYFRSLILFKSRTLFLIWHRFESLVSD